VRRRHVFAAIAVGLGLPAVCFSGFGCKGSDSATPSGDASTIKIVSSLPRTGSAKGQTDTIVNGIKMALEEVEYKSGNFKIVYEDLDDATAAEGKWTPERESANADQAVKDSDVMVYIGPYNSGAAKNSMPITNKAGLLMISPAVTWPGMTKPGKGDHGEPEMYRPTGKVNFTRVVPADDLQGPLGAAWAKSMGVKTATILDDNEVYGKGIATLFKERCEEIGIEVLGKQESIDIKQNDFKSLMTKIVTGAAKPDLIYFGGTSQTKAGQIAKDMVEAGLDGSKLMVPDGCCELAFIQSAGNDVFKTLKCYVTFGGLPPDQVKGKGKEFVEKYKAKYGKSPEAYAVYGYEAGKVALEAIKRSGKKDRAEILKACLSIKDYDGALGKWSFDENGDTTSRTMSGSIVNPAKGDFDFVAQLDILPVK